MRYFAMQYNKSRNFLSSTNSTNYAMSYTTYTTNRPSIKVGLLIWCSNNNQQESTTTINSKYITIQTKGQQIKYNGD